MSNDMGLLDRAWRLIRANFSDAVSRAEDPEKVLEQALADMQANLIQLRQSVAQAIATQKRTERQSAQAKTMAQEWYNRAELAMQKGEEDLARQALTRRQSYLESAHTMDTQLAQQQDVVAKLKENMRKLEAKITEAKTKKDLYIARARSAEASQRIQEMLGQTGDTGMAAFSRMEDRVLELEAQSEALEELSRDPLESQFAALEQSAENAVDDEMAALRQRLTGEGGSQESLPQGPNPSN